jgi:rhamnogalacturonyl hydrolase YesR
MEAGYSEFAHVAPKGDVYTQMLTGMARKANWTLPLRAKTPFHADDFCIGQTFLDLEANESDPAHLAPLKQRLDALVDHLNQPADLSNLTFWWCDALFMAPPVLTRMSAVTGDRKYIDAMDKEFWRTTKLLYDPQEHLFYRDAHFLHQLDANDKKIFWSRGNGWVLAGLARVLQYMPADYPSRGKYETLFKDMASRLSALQSTDGTWPSSLLDPQLFGGPESSGTALFTYAMAWGVNHNLLDHGTYFPILGKAWNALLEVRRSDGLPGFVQSVGYQPGAVNPGDTQLYATGGYLLAASELQRLAPLIVADPAPATQPSTQPMAHADSAPAQPAPGTRAFARYVPERMDDIAWENDRIAHRIYGPALEHNPKEHSGSGIDVWVKSVREPVINEWYLSKKYHVNRGTGLDFYEVGLSRGDGGLGIWDNGKLYNSKDWVDYKILNLGLDQCGFDLDYAPWDAKGRKVWEHRTMTLKAGSNLDRIQSTIDSDKPGDIIIGIGLAKRAGAGGKLMQNKDQGVMSYWQPPEKDGTIGVGVLVDPKMIVGFDEDPLNYLILVKATAGKPFVYYAGACWDKGLDFKKVDEWETYLMHFKRE